MATRREFIKIVDSVLSASTSEIDALRKFAVDHLDVIISRSDAAYIIDICEQIKAGQLTYWQAIHHIADKCDDEKAERLKTTLCSIKQAIVREQTTIVTTTGSTVCEELDKLLQTQCGVPEDELKSDSMTWAHVRS